jgi:GH25 family lysozyme M1 (1,4-beta-N-acetylmuramidase)
MKRTLLPPYPRSSRIGAALLAASLLAAPGLASPAAAEPSPTATATAVANPTPTPSATPTGTPAASPSVAAPAPTATTPPPAPAAAPSSAPAATDRDPAAYRAAMAKAAGPGGAQMGQGLRTARTTTEALTPESTWMPTFGVQGLDVSNYQAGINWQQQWNMGARFAYIKATEGNYYSSPSFGAQYQGARAVGMIRGAYHFANPMASSGADQARLFVRGGGGWSADGYTLPPVLDFEGNPYAGQTINGFYQGNTCYDMSPGELASWARDFGNTMLALTGRLPVMYTTTSWWNYCTGDAAGFGDFPLWIARWPSSPTNDAGPLPSSWSGYSFWQYSESGPFAGGGDSNVWNGDLASLREFAGASAKAATSAIAQEAADSASVLGRAWGGVTCGLTNGGCYQIFQGGAILWSPSSGAHTSNNGAIRGAYQSTGFENGPLGYPVMGPEFCGLKNGGCYQMFQGGAILWSGATNAQISKNGPIRSTYAGTGFENGYLGYPASGQICGLKKAGCYQMFQGGAILWSPGTGAHPSPFGAIRGTYGSFGFENGRPGYPTSPEHCGSKNGGCYQMYETGAIVWGPGLGAFFSPFGAIRGVWASQGFEYGWMGYPLSNETCSTSTNCRQVFQGAILTWTPATGVRVTRR